MDESLGDSQDRAGQWHQLFLGHSRVRLVIALENSEKRIRPIGGPKRPGNSVREVAVASATGSPAAFARAELNEVVVGEGRAARQLRFRCRALAKRTLEPATGRAGPLFGMLISLLK